MKLSVGIITFNEEVILCKTLQAVKNIADEIIIVDSHSTDKTVKIAESFGAKVFLEDWKGFGLQKNSVLDKCQGDWILLIDADEVVSPELSERIKELINKRDSKSVYKINLCSVCFGKELKHGGWSNDYHIRLWKKDIVRFNDRFVHEGFITNEEAGKIKEKIYHYTYINLYDYLEKFNRYTTLGAKEYFNRNRKAGICNIILNPLYTFIKMYIIKRGFLDGIEGFVIAFFSSAANMAKYFKLREMYKINGYKSHN